MKRYFIFLIFIITLSGFLARAQNNEFIKSEIFSCGEHGPQGGYSFHLALAYDGRLVAFLKYIGESIAEKPPVYLAAKISTEKQDTKCIISVKENLNPMPNYSYFKFDLSGSQAVNFKLTSFPMANVSDEVRRCILSPEFEKTLGQCNYSKDDYDFDIRDLYSCRYAGGPMKINPAENNLKILEETKDEKVCLRKVFCRWDHDSKILKIENLKPFYDSWAACLPEKGICSQDYEHCKHDPRLAFEIPTIGDQEIIKTLGFKVVR